MLHNVFGCLRCGTCFLGFGGLFIVDGWLFIVVLVSLGFGVVLLCC